MKKIYLINVLVISLLLYSAGSLFAQEESPKYGINFSGYVKNDFYYDSRQTIDVREGHLLLFPANVLPDEDGKDINSHPSYHFVSIQTRLTGKITAPDAFGAKTSGIIEAEFFGNTQNTINEFRLRHAFMKLNWTKTELLMGQYWHPMFVTENFPGTVSINTGIGFQPFSRNTQIRLSYQIGNIKFIGVCFGERDFPTRDANGSPNVAMVRNSITPHVHFQTQYIKKNEENGNEFIAGLGAGYKTVMPQIATSENYYSEQTLGSLSAFGYVSLKTKPVTVRFETVYGENMTDVLFFGGFAVLNVLDEIKNELSYASVRNASFWTDISTNGKIWQAGLFAGYNRNLGTEFKVVEGPFGLAPNIASLYRMSPRVMWNSGKVRVAFEVEYTVAMYGDGTYNRYAVPNNPNEVGNLRFLIGTYLFF